MYQILRTIKKAKFKILAILAVALFITIPAFKVLAAGQFRGGNTYIVSNTTHPAWGDPVAANVGDIVQFKVDIANLGDQTATNVRVKADLPTGVSGTSIASTIHVTADGVSQMSDTATVTLPSTSTAKNLVYFPGHAFLITNAGSTQLPETISSSGVSIGSVLVGANNYVEVTFKATVTETVQPTPTPTTSPTPTPTVSPTPTATPTPTGTPSPTPTGTLTPTPTITVTPTPGQNVVQCPAGFVQTISGSNIICIQQVQSQSQSSSSTSNASTGDINITNTSSAVVPVPAVAGVSTNITQLPKTGLPELIWLMSGIAPAGLAIRRFGSRGKGNQDSASYIWQQREFQKD